MSTDTRNPTSTSSLCDQLRAAVSAEVHPRGVRDGEHSGKGWTKGGLACRARVGRATMDRLLAGEDIDRAPAERIARALGMRFELVRVARPAEQAATPATGV